MVNWVSPLGYRAIGAEDSSVPASRTGTTRASYSVRSVSSSTGEAYSENAVVDNMSVIQGSLFGPCLGFLRTSRVSPVVVPAGTAGIHTKLMEALKRKQDHYRETYKQEMSFTRVLLKLGAARDFMRDVRLAFDEKDADKSGRIDMAEMCAAMRALSVDLSDDEIKALFQLADFYEDKNLTMKQFVAVLAMGYVLDAIPDLLERAGETSSGGGQRRKSQFNNREDTVRQGLELFTYAYLLFDKECRGAISRQDVTSIISEQGQKDHTSMVILSQERWEEMDWDSNGDISFGEFVYAFTKWVDVEHGEDHGMEPPMAIAVGHSEFNNAAPREEGKARRKASVSAARRTSAIAKEIGRRISTTIEGTRRASHARMSAYFETHDSPKTGVDQTATAEPKPPGAGNAKLDEVPAVTGAPGAPLPAVQHDAGVG